MPVERVSYKSAQTNSVCVGTLQDSHSHVALEDSYVRRRTQAEINEHHTK